MADETRLLALNPSLLAAQVGETGAGFRVVVSHVRDLATSTRDSARSISELASSLEQAAPAVLSSIGTMRGRVQEMAARATALRGSSTPSRRRQRCYAVPHDEWTPPPASRPSQLVGTTTDTAKRMERPVHAAHQQTTAAERLDASSASLREAVTTIGTHAHEQVRLAGSIAVAAGKDAERPRALEDVAATGRPGMDVAGSGTTVGTVSDEATTLRTELARFRLP